MAKRPKAYVPLTRAHSTRLTASSSSTASSAATSAAARTTAEPTTSTHSLEPRVVTRRLENLTLNSENTSTLLSSNQEQSSRSHTLAGSHRPPQAPLTSRLLRNHSLSCRSENRSKKSEQNQTNVTPTTSTSIRIQNSSDDDDASIAMSIKLHPRNSIKRSQEDIKSMLTRFRTKHANFMSQKQGMSQSVVANNESVIADDDSSLIRRGSLRKRRSDLNFNKGERSKYELRSTGHASSSNETQDNGSMLSVDDANSSSSTLTSNDSSYSNTTSSSSNLRRNLRR
jgi:hypothetical protein